MTALSHVTLNASAAWLSCRDTAAQIVENRQFSLPHCPILFRLKFGGVPLIWSRSVMLGFAENEMVRLISREIIFAEFQPI